jgi:hypothetical protein
MTKNEFYENICAFKGNFENRELETYLLSLLKLVEQEKNQNLTADFIERHKMNGKQLNEEMRYFGVDSETGNRWFNF